ncbi:MAG: amidohydrolase family protein [Chthoniobacterales bacterium]
MKDSASFSMYRAHYVMPMSAPVIEGGAVVVRDGVIVAVGKYHDLEREYIGASYHDLGSVILMPGLINAHCHLDYTMMRGKLTPGSRFATWVQELNKIKFSLHEDDWVKSIVEGAQELRSWGCTTLCNIESFQNFYQNFLRFLYVCGSVSS